MVSRIGSSINAGLASASLCYYSTYTGIRERRLVDRLPPKSPSILYDYLPSSPPYRLLVPIVLKPGSLNLLEPSGPVQAFLWSLPLCIPHPLSSHCVHTVLVGDNILIIVHTVLVRDNILIIVHTVLVGDNILSIVASDRRLVLVDSWQEGGRESPSGTEGKVSWAVSPTAYGREYFRGPSRVSRKVGKA
jgi:hypothetical protein